MLMVYYDDTYVRTKRVSIQWTINTYNVMKSFHLWSHDYCATTADTTVERPKRCCFLVLYGLAVRASCERTRPRLLKLDSRQTPSSPFLPPSSLLFSLLSAILSPQSLLPSPRSLVLAPASSILAPQPLVPIP